MKVGIVIPACNVGRQLRSVLLKCLQYVSGKRIYVIDDGSTDQTPAIAQSAGTVVLRHRWNQGKGAALKTGFEKVLSDGLDGVFTLDGDGQHDPEFIPSFLSVMEKTDCDMVVGKRPFRFSEMEADRILSNRLSSLAVSFFTGFSIHDSQCGFRLIRSQVIESIELKTGHFETETEFLIKSVWGGCKIGFCPIDVVGTDYQSQIRRLPDSVRFCRLMINLLAERI